MQVVMTEFNLQKRVIRHTYEYARVSNQRLDVLCQFQLSIKIIQGKETYTKGKIAKDDNK